MLSVFVGLCRGVVLTIVGDHVADRVVVVFADLGVWVDSGAEVEEADEIVGGDFEFLSGGCEGEHFCSFRCSWLLHYYGSAAV
nr:MAG TPA: hypothetical protein [Caudoviricetes sp.]DAX73753.1 MAG TPA: hypothetical protein [Caudoviricetes sp.]